MTEENIIELARCLTRVFKIYKRQKNPVEKQKWLENLRAYCFTFQSACNKFYHEEKRADEWLRYIREKEKNRKQ